MNKKVGQFMNISTVLLMLAISLSNVQIAWAQDLQSERIRSMSSRKRSIYLESGIFHNGSESLSSEIKSVRHNYSSKRGYERLVFDFKTSKVPRIYGYISAKERKMYIDFFETSLNPDIGSFGQSQYIKAINFYPINDESLSVEVEFKEKITLDIFYLDSPGRFVVDIKE